MSHVGNCTWKADPESLNASPQDQEYIHQLEEEMSRLRLGQGLTEDRIAEASAEGGESAVSKSVALSFPHMH